MELLLSSLTLSGVAWIGIGLLILVSLWSLVQFWFGGPDPLVRNAEARVEAAQNAANLLVAGQEYRRARRFRGVVVWAVIFAVLTILSPDAAEAIISGFGLAIKSVFDQLVALLERLAAEVQI